jgi:hypothetical protein
MKGAVLGVKRRKNVIVLIALSCGLPLMLGLMMRLIGSSNGHGYSPHDKALPEAPYINWSSDVRR